MPARGSAVGRMIQAQSGGLLAGMGITRQLAALDDLLRRATKVPEIEAVVLIGSLASGAADSVSDVDAIVIVGESSFDAAYQQRHASTPPQFRRAGITRSTHPPMWRRISGSTTAEFWSKCSSRPRPDHCGSPSRPGSYSATRRYSPRTTRRPPITREEMIESAHPVESAYDKLKEAVRHASLQPPTA